MPASPSPANGADLPIAIVGAGFSGTLLAINLLRLGARVVLVERDREKLARGLAFGTRAPEHLLNVRAANMSAFPDDPGHFLRWMGFSSQEQANRFAPRLTYGQYLREQLLAALAAAPGRFAIREEEALGIDWHADHAALRLASGQVIAARAVVLALGNFAPARLPVLAGLAPPVLIDNPWSAAVTQDLEGIDHVLLVGTGLTAVDVALSLEKAGYRGRITALSRRGLAPRAHAAEGPVVGAVPRPEARGSWLLRQLRRRAGHVGWRHAVDELRAHTQSLWRQHDAAAQARFLRHLRPWWDVHRHRLAPPVAEVIDRLRADGRLDFVAGRLLGAEPRGDGAHVRWQPRGGGPERQLDVGRVVLCTGPEGDITRSDHPLLRALVAEGRARADVHRLGLDVDHTGSVLDAQGRRQPHLYAVGPVTKGEAWEIIAVPDIRRQVWHLARMLSNTHWIGGEGL
ncbi:MAG TPA: FAD/NAD(P)-binding protein [Novosphingobium sp.]|nr:FAD/NAD(P)-binding protein [Novosphingobium sp.]